MTSGNELPRPGDILAGRYRILRHLGVGGFGDLYVAEQIALGREVALKVLLPDKALDETARARFRLEACAACQLTHPHVVVYHDFGEYEHGRLFLVMELLAGRSLAEVLAGGRLLPLGSCVRVMQCVCDALQAGHDAGIVHRDLKPANVMLMPRSTGEDYVKVIDFGILKRVGMTRGPSDDITRTGEIVGTPEYLAPEIIRGEGFDGRVDQYAAGVMTYELLAGRRPFSGRSPHEVAYAQVHDDAASLSSAAAGRRISPRLEAVVRRAMDKEPSERFPDMASFARALAQAAGDDALQEAAERTRVAGSSPPTPPVDAPSTVIDFAAKGTVSLADETPAGPAGRSSRRRFAAVAAAVVLVGALVGWFWPRADAEHDDASSAPAAKGAASVAARAPSPAATRGGADGDTVDSARDVGATELADVGEDGGSRPDILPDAAPDGFRDPAAPSALPSSSSEPARVRSRTPPPPESEARPATLVVNAEPYARITVDGKTYGTTPVRIDGLRPGRHRVRASHPTLGHETKRVRLRAGQTRRLRFSFR